MATTTQAVEQFARDIGEPAAAVYRVARALRGTDRTLWPTSGLGGGSKAAHVPAPPLVNMILALIAPQPSEAADMVRALRPLRHVGGRAGGTTSAAREGFALFGDDGEVLAGLDFGQTLEWIIGRVAEWKASSDEESARKLQRLRDVRWRIEAVPFLLTIWTSWNSADGVSHSETYLPPQGVLAHVSIDPPVRARIERGVTIQFALIESAAELLLDTARATMGDLLNPGRAGATTTPESETPTPWQGPASDTDQPSNGKTGTLTSPDRSGERDSTQLYPRHARAPGKSGHPSNREGSDHDRGPPHSIDAAAA